MITVFGILALVALTGKVLIKVINNRYQEEKRPVFVSKTQVRQQRKRLSDAQLAAIIAAVDAVTAGQGRIERIEKVP